MKTLGFHRNFAAISTFLGLSAALLSAAPQAGSGKVTGVRGTATINGEGARVNGAVAAGSVLTTGSESQLDVYIGVNGPTIRLLDNSRLSIDDLTFDSAGAEPVISTKLGLKEGKVAGHVKKTSDQSTYRVETPTATASIRGTKYLVSADGSVYVWDGCVNVSFRGINYNVCAGQAFDPAVPGVIENPLPYPGPTDVAPGEAPKPVGPVVPLSPVAPGGSVTPVFIDE